MEAGHSKYMPNFVLNFLDKNKWHSTDCVIYVYRRSFIYSLEYLPNSEVWVKRTISLDSTLASTVPNYVPIGTQRENQQPLLHFLRALVPLLSSQEEKYRQKIPWKFNNWNTTLHIHTETSKLWSFYNNCSIN